MNRFIRDIKKYYHYALYAARCDLKSEVADSYLNWLWWILDPLFFMLVYMFIALVVFRRSEPYFPVFVFIGLTIWNFFSKNISSSVTMIKANKAIVTKVYVPKFILVLEGMAVNFFKMMMSFGIVVVLMAIYRVPLSVNLLSVVPILVVLATVTFGVSNLLMHYGVFIADLSNIMTILLRLMMYMSGIFYSVADRVPAPYNYLLLRLKPAAMCMDAMRRALLHQTAPSYLWLLAWFIMGLGLSAVSINLVYRYENSYARVML
jgi:teichoic acid transport system permease protein